MALRRARWPLPYLRRAQGQRGHGSEYEGTCLGLAIVRKAAERMQGKVGVDSSPGQGSRFWVELKAAK